MADARPGAVIVHIARLDPMEYRAVSRVPARFRNPSAPLCQPLRQRVDTTLVNPSAMRVKHPGDVILPPIAFGCLRARLAASCSLVSLAVQSLRSM
ncbi:hypothetical protein BOG92_030955 [Streptomyces sp. WAC00263]|nr:hypothetical protein BOG92_030955 [Streptomyces sp. WAC00263]